MSRVVEKQVWMDHNLWQITRMDHCNLDVLSPNAALNSNNIYPLYELYILRGEAIASGFLLGKDDRIVDGDLGDQGLKNKSWRARMRMRESRNGKLFKAPVLGVSLTFFRSITYERTQARFFNSIFWKILSE